MPPTRHEACSRDFTFSVSDAHPQHPVPNADQTPTPEPSSAVCTFTHPHPGCALRLSGHPLTQRPRSLPTSAQSSDSEGDAATWTSIRHVGSVLPTPDHLCSAGDGVTAGRHHRERHLSTSEA